MTTINFRGGGFMPRADLTRKVVAKRAELDPGARGRLLESELKATMSGEVHFDAGSRAVYSHDGSNYRRVPVGVVFPNSQADVVAAVAAARKYGVPIASRGGGTALAGQTVNEALVIDHSRAMKRIPLIDFERKRARVELGVVCDELTDKIHARNLTFGPKPATHSRCCFGGMLSNNCGGGQAQMNGTAVNNIESVDIVLYDGTRMTLGWTNDAEVDAQIQQGGRAAEVLVALRALRAKYADAIRKGFPQIPRRISGYNLDRLLSDENGNYNLARIIVGSEGTLATMLEAELTLIDLPPFTAMALLGYEDVFQAADAAPAFVAMKPLSLEGIDDILVGHIKKKGGENAEKIAVLPEDAKAWLNIEFGGWSQAEANALAEAAVARANGLVSSRVLVDPASQAALKKAREGGLGATAFVPDEPDAWEGWEDSAVPPEKLGAYLRDLRALYNKYDYRTSLYGHFGMGLVHCRVSFDLYTEHGVRTYRRFLNDAAELVVSHGGSLSGEHGDGQSRGELLGKMFSPELVEAMRELKAIFDPEGKMNPGKIVDPYPITDHLKVFPRQFNTSLDTHFRFPDDGGSLERAALRCVGVGECRREKGEGTHDTMCPSYMVTRDEKHSTRGRARMLWEMVRGEGPITEGWQDENVKEALDLCLACKGCKGDCPVNVDISTHKAEFFSHYYEKHTRPRHAYAFGLINVWARLAEFAPGLANLATQLPGISALAKVAAGVSLQSKIPAFAGESFRARFARRERKNVGARRVVLWADTFNDHFHPDTLTAALNALEDAGYDVVLPRERVCCGRPLYDFGMLDQAKSYLENMLRVLKPEIIKNTPVVVLEPSCASVLKDELHNLLPERDDATALRNNTMLLGEFLMKEARHYTLPQLPGVKAIVQGHCHHKSILDFESDKAALTKMGLEVEVLESGCCGMAGAFGFVNETHDVGKAAGERVLLPRVRKEPESTLVVANGFSCREQIQQNTPRHGLHLAELLNMALAGGVKTSPPEKGIVQRRKANVRRTMTRAAVGLFAIAAAVYAVGRLRRALR